MRWDLEVDEWGRVTAFRLRTDDGAPVDNVPLPAGVQLVAVPGQPPALTLYLKEGVDIHGAIPVNVETGGSPRATVLGWLATLDPNALEQAALLSLGGFGPSSTGEGFLAALRADAEQLP